jgi:hypothetical protein
MKSSLAMVAANDRIVMRGSAGVHFRFVLWVRL